MRHRAVIAVRADKALRPVADEILASGLFERLDDELFLVGAEPLEQRALQFLAVRRRLGEDRCHIARVDAGVVHAGRERTGRGVEVLHLLGFVTRGVQKFRELHGVLERAAGVGRHEVGNEILLAPVLFVHGAVLVPEFFKHVEVRLSHVVEHARHAVLGRDLELAGDVVFDELGQKGTSLVLEQIVIPDARADEDLLHAGDRAKTTQQLDIFRVVGIEIFAGVGGEAVFVAAHAALQLILARRMAEVGARTADVVDVALELRVVGEALDLAHAGFDRARGDHAPLMERQRAEVASAEAPAVVRDGKAHLLDGGDAAESVVHRVHLAHVGELSDLVELFARKRHRGRIDDERVTPVRLPERFAANGVVLLVFELCRERVGVLVPAHLFI